MRVILLCIIYLNFLYANDYSKKLYVNIIKAPKEIFYHQRFAISYKILITSDEYTDYKIDFNENDSIKILNINSPWVIEDNNTLTNTFYFKALSTKVKIPVLNVSLYEDNEKIDESYSKSLIYNAKKVAQKSQFFCGVIASKLKVVDTIIKQSDNKYAIAVFEIEAFNANLEDFKLKKYDNLDNIESYDDELNYQKIFYYIKIPVSTSEISFNYFNINTKSFDKIVVPINIKEILSTQTDLNPEQSDLNLVKKIILIFFIVLCLILFLIYRKRIYLVICIIFIILLIYLLIPLKTIVIKKDTDVRILPTYNSTIFKKLSKGSKVKVLKTYKNYIKIIMPDDTIGWIKK